MGDATPTGVTALGSYTAYYRTQNITLSNEGALFITFLYSTGQHQLEILGVDLLNSNDEVVRSDYHYGKTGTLLSHNVYMLDHIASGDYKIRFIINSGVSNSVGNITVKHLNIKTSNSYENITNWYFVRMHSNQTNYMYYDKSERGIAFSSSKQNNAHYLWGFVKDTDGIRIYNKAAGSSVALDDANPCTLSASGTSLAFTFGSGSVGNNGAAAGAYFSLYKNPDKSATARSYLNYRSNGTIQRYGTDDQGSAWMIDETTISAPFVSASEGKVYKIQAYFSDSDNLYFTNNGTNLAFNTSASSGVNDYWILRSSGDGNYPWRFESGRGDGKFLSNNSATEGLSETGVYLQINSIDSYFNLCGSNNGDATTTNIVNLGTWTGNKSGFGKYGSGGCWSSTGNNDSGWSTKYIIEEVTGVDIYTVVSNINAGGVNKTTYTGKSEQTNGGYYILASAPSAGDFSAISVTDFTPSAITVNTTTKTITVNYTANITYTLTDMNGKTYSWSASGEFGTAPTITGCDGATISNEVWNEGSRTYTADITFPFPISSNSKTNWTYIGSFATNSYTTSRLCWYVKSSDATKFYSGQDDLPTNQSGELEKWEWSIIPACSNGEFSFTIKNASTNKYVTMAATPSAGFSDQISLTNTGTAFTFNNHRWKLPTATELYISQNSSTADEQEVGVYGPNGSQGIHTGNDIAFITPANFTALLNNLKTAYTSYMNYFLAFTEGSYTQSVAGKMETAYANNVNVQKAIADPPTKYLTASEFQTFTDAYNNAVDGLNYVMPSGKFIRIKNVAGTKYVKDLVATYNADETIDFSEGGTDATSIFYVDASNKMIAYKSGLYLFATNNTPRITMQSSADTYEFLKGSAPLQLYVHSANNPTGWGGDNRYWAVNESSSKIDRVASTSSASEFMIEEVSKLPVTIGTSGYATLYSPVALEVPSGVTAFWGENSAVDNAILVHAINAGEVIPANNGVVLYTETGNTTYNFNITTGGSISGTNVITGTVTTKARSEEYTLQNGSEGIAFYADAVTNLQGFKAYLPSGSSYVMQLIFDEETVVKAIEAAMNPGKVVYDMNGRRVENPSKGLYIVNGKKVIFK